MNRTPIHPAHDEPEFAANVRRLLTTMTADAPRAPDFDQRDELVLLPKVVEIHRHPRRALVGALAVAAAVTAGTIAVSRHEPSESQGAPPAVVNPTPGAIVGLPAHVLPTFVPPGWDLVDIQEIRRPASDPTGLSFFPQQVFRRATDGAGISLNIGTPLSYASTADAPQVDPGMEQILTSPDGAPLPERIAVTFVDGRSDFSEAGIAIRADAIGLTDDEATALVLGLIPNSSRSILTFDVPADSAFALASEQMPPQTPPGDYVEGTLNYLIDGKVGFSIDVSPTVTASDPTAPASEPFGVRTVVNGVTLYVDRFATTRESFGGITVRAHHNLVDPAVVAQVLASLRVVDGAEWTKLADELAGRWLVSETVQRLKVGEVDISSHRDGVVRSVCVVRLDVRRCHNSIGNDDAPNEIRADSWNAFDIGDGWVFAGMTDRIKSPVTGITVELDRGEATNEWETADGEVLYAIVLSDSTTRGIVQVEAANDGWQADLELPII